MSPAPARRPRDGCASLGIDDYGAGSDIHGAKPTYIADRETLIRDLVNGEYNHPARVVAFNTVEGWSRDVTVN